MHIYDSLFLLQRDSLMYFPFPFEFPLLDYKFYLFLIYTLLVLSVNTIRNSLVAGQHKRSKSQHTVSSFHIIYYPFYKLDLRSDMIYERGLSTTECGDVISNCRITSKAWSRVLISPKLVNMIVTIFLPFLSLVMSIFRSLH